MAAALTVGLVGVGVPVALAGEMDEDTVNNKLKLTMTLTCKDKRKPVTLTWSSLAPAGTVTVTATWYDLADDPNLHNPTPATAAAAARGVRIKNGTASGTLTIPRLPKGSRDGHRIALFIDAFNGPTDVAGEQTLIGIGRNIDAIDCTWPPTR